MDKKDIKPTAAPRTRQFEEDDPIMTSTDSEIFGTWTLVKDKQKPLATTETQNEIETLKKDEIAEDDVITRVEELKRDEQQESEEDKESDSFKPHPESSMDEISDGIAVISETDSPGRISPHPLLREHLNDFGLKINTNTEYDLPKMAQATIDATGALFVREDATLKQRRRKRSSSSHALQKAETINTVAEPPTRMPPMIRKGLTGLFYIGCLLGAVAIIGRLRNPEWGPTGGSKQLDDLEQKLTDMELHNNLMRAEIDILTKQVNYLNTLKDQQQSGGYKPDYKAQDNKDKTNQKQDPSAKFVKAQPENTKYTYSKLPNVNSDQPNLELSEAMRNIDKINADLKETLGQVDDKLNAAKENESQTNAGNRGEKKYYNSKQHQNQRSYIKDHSKEYHEKHFKVDSNQQHRDSSKQYHEKRFKKDSNEHQKDNSKEYHDKRFKKGSNERHKDNSKEHHDKRFKTDSDERHQKSGEHFGGDKKDGHWHEQYMNHRANERRSNEKQRNDKNWFIERGNSREQQRYVDHRYR